MKLELIDALPPNDSSWKFTSIGITYRPDFFGDLSPQPLKHRCF